MPSDKVPFEIRARRLLRQWKHWHGLLLSGIHHWARIHHTWSAWPKGQKSVCGQTMDTSEHRCTYLGNHILACKHAQHTVTNIQTHWRLCVCGFWQAAGNDRGHSIEAHEEKEKRTSLVGWTYGKTKHENIFEESADRSWIPSSQLETPLVLY